MGTYTEIVEIIAPVGADVGDTVNVEVRVRNLHTYDITIAITGKSDETILSFSPSYAKVSAGQIRSFTASFVMPNKDVRVLVWSFYWGVDDDWHQDDDGYRDISLGVTVAGSIIRKELEYSGSGDGTVPVVGVPQGVRAKLHVWGRNDMSISQGMGIYWFVADPDGEIAEEYTDWGGTIGAGRDHEFISSGQFDLNKVGKYTTWIELLMGSQSNPEIVDRYIGHLCTVVAELVPGFSQLAISSFSKA